jgi:hypothetical protein
VRVFDLIEREAQQMWARLDDELLDHPKVSLAGRAIGKNGRVIAIGFYAMALMWSNKHLSDGVLPVDVLEGFSVYVANPLAVADALAKAGLFDKGRGSYRIHDYAEHNPSASQIKAKRKADRLRKQRERMNGTHVHA